MKRLKLIVALASSMFCSACLTITRGSTEDVHFTSAPSGADVTVNGSNRGKTPTTADLKRKRTYSVTFEKECYETEHRQIQRKFDFPLWFLGNAVLGGVVGWIVDVSTGAAWKLRPGTLSVTLLPKETEQCKAQAGQVPSNSTETPESAVTCWVGSERRRGEACN